MELAILIIVIQSIAICVLTVVIFLIFHWATKPDSFNQQAVIAAIKQIQKQTEKLDETRTRNTP
jgi:flagellar basal body-associated protein FliL